VTGPKPVAPGTCHAGRMEGALWEAFVTPTEAYKVGRIRPTVQSALQTPPTGAGPGAGHSVRKQCARHSREAGRQRAFFWPAAAKTAPPRAFFACAADLERVRLEKATRGEKAQVHAALSPAGGLG